MMLPDKLYKLNSFQNQMAPLVKISVGLTINELNWKDEKNELLKLIDWNNILGISSSLSTSEKAIYQEVALRIAQTCLIEETCSEQQKISAAFILEKLTNNQSIKLAIKRNLINDKFHDNYSFGINIESLKAEFENTIFFKDKILFLNKFQSKVFEMYENNDVLSISAPTSAGKSFILCRMILDSISKYKNNIIYIVPTRALISQVETDLRDLMIENDVTNINISTVPQHDFNSDKSNIFVFTQERLHWFLIEHDKNIDVLIIDEAHKIEDGNRGILLQSKIEQVIKSNPKIKVYFSSPYTSNPELLSNNVSLNCRKDTIETDFVAVNQNLIYVNQVPRKTDEWNLLLQYHAKEYNLGTIKLKDRATSELKKMVLIAESVTKTDGGTVIYCNGAAQAEKISLLLFNHLNDIEENDNTRELIKLVKKTIHKDYQLAKVLKKGIAFHYGNMPLLIRQEIEKLFKNGDIAYLICTSTLLEGVNLPAKNIIIRKPTRGVNKPLNSSDFWNLAGRAGRWGKEFSGNIICIEPTKWEEKPNTQKSKQKIKRAVDEIKDNIDELLDYIRSNTPREIASKRQDLEFAFCYFYQKYMDEEFDMEDKVHIKLKKVIGPISKDIKLPDYILKRNPGISPIAQQSLFEYFNSNIDTIEDYIPVYPEDENAVAEYTKLVGRIGKTIADYPYQLNYTRSILIVNWMIGKPLSYLIWSSKRAYDKKEDSKKTLPTIIREVMDNVETFVRFQFAKDSSCYIDILRYFLEINNMESLSKSIPELNLWLEFGVSLKTHLSMLSLGLSRNTVIELSSFITNSDLSRNECLKWLKEQDFTLMEISPIIQQDIKKVFDFNKI